MHCSIRPDGELLRRNIERRGLNHAGISQPIDHHPPYNPNYSKARSFPAIGPFCVLATTRNHPTKTKHKTERKCKMSVKILTNYAKRLGLPGYSSHQFSISIETELLNLEQVPAEIARLYQSLQQSVDREIQQTGFVPDDSYGMASQTAPSNDAAQQQVHHQLPNATPPPNPEPAVKPTWQCSAKQHLLINDLARRLELDEQQVDARAQRLFNKPAYQLNRLSASGLISDLLAEAGPKRAQNGSGQQGNRQPVPTNGNGGGA